MAHFWPFSVALLRWTGSRSSYRRPHVKDDKGLRLPSMADPSLWQWEVQQSVPRATLCQGRLHRFPGVLCLLEEPVFSRRDVPVMSCSGPFGEAKLFWTGGMFWFINQSRTSVWTHRVTFNSLSFVHLSWQPTWKQINFPKPFPSERPHECPRHRKRLSNT